MAGVLQEAMCRGTQGRSACEDTARGWSASSASLGRLRIGSHHQKLEQKLKDKHAQNSSTESSEPTLLIS